MANLPCVQVKASGLAVLENRSSGVQGKRKTFLYQN